MSDENRYHRQSIRLKSHDYSQMGYYFLTIVVQDHISVFGNIENGIVVYNELGKFVQKCWMEIPSHFPEIKLHQYIIMPNHIHGILQITNNNLVGAYQHTPTAKDIHSVNADIHSVKADIHSVKADIHSVKADIHSAANDISDNGERAYVDTPVQLRSELPQLSSPSKTIGSVVRGFKIGVTKWYRQNYTDRYREKLWQRNYHEHIIRNEKSYENISKYIEQNPMKWNEDRFYE